MKRQIHSSSPLSFVTVDDVEPVPKRPRILMISPLPASSSDSDDDEEILVDELIIPSVTITEDSENESNDDDDDVIEIDSLSNVNGVIFVSDSESDDESDDQGIDVTDDILPSVSSTNDEFSSFSPAEDVEILSGESEDEQMNFESSENFTESELIDLTADEPLSISNLPNASERKLSIDVQQCPICLETLSHLQENGIYLSITRCCHVMCTLCSRTLLATSSRCPLCRENVSSTSLMPYCILT